MTTTQPLLLGYVRALPELADHAVNRLCEELTAFAEREGFVLLDIYVERKWLHVAAWDALVEHCARADVRHVVVPTYEHLHSLPALSFVMQAVIEEAIDGSVWFARADAEANNQAGGIW